MSDTEFFGNFTQISDKAALVLHYRCAADYFQVGHSGEASQNFILHTIGEVSVLFLVAQILERKNRDALLGNGSRHASSCSPGSRRCERRRGCPIEKDQ